MIHTPSSGGTNAVSSFMAPKTLMSSPNLFQPISASRSEGEIKPAHKVVSTTTTTTTTALLVLHTKTTEGRGSDVVSRSSSSSSSSSRGYE